MTAPGLDDDRMFTVVEEIFRTQINPAVGQHGGRIDLLDVEDGVVVGIISIGDVVKDRIDTMEMETSVLRDYIVAHN